MHPAVISLLKNIVNKLIKIAGRLHTIISSDFVPNLSWRIGRLFDQATIVGRSFAVHTKEYLLVHPTPITISRIEFAKF